MQPGLHPTPYLDLNHVLQYLVERVQAVLGKNFVGAYLQGSFAVGDFDEHSDVDFIIVIEEKLSEQEVEALQTVHGQVYALESAWAQHLEGSYFPRSVLRQPPDGRALWFLGHGSSFIIQSDHCNTLLVRWVVREQGVTLAGPPPATLVDPITIPALRREMLATIQEQGRKTLAQPEPYNNRFEQAYLVLNYCRMLHDLRNGYPGSKLAGANWAKATLDPSWHGLIDRAWAGRSHPALTSRQPADPADFQAALEFLRYIISEATSYAQANHLE